MDFCEQLSVGKRRRLPTAGSACASRADVLQKHLWVLPEPSDCTRTWQHNPQQEPPASLEELPTDNLHPAGEADKSCFTTRAAVAFDKP